MGVHESVIPAARHGIAKVCRQRGNRHPLRHLGAGRSEPFLRWPQRRFDRGKPDAAREPRVIAVLFAIAAGGQRPARNHPAH